MSFYLDDDDDDRGFAHGRTSLLNASQGSNVSFAVSLSQGGAKSSMQSISDSFLLPNHKINDDAPNVDFQCRNCGSIDAYLDETTNDIICNVCFTQSQVHVDSSQQQFDFEDAMNMANKSRDGRIMQSKQAGTPSAAAGTQKRKARPLSEYDNTHKQPSLSDCLHGFQTVLQAACSIVCRDLLTVPLVKKRKHNCIEKSGDSNTDEHSFSSSGEEASTETQPYKHMKVETTKRVFATVRKLWKAYLWSWHEAAEHYAKLYPQVRFSFRDSFLLNHVKGMLYKTLAARAVKELKIRIQQEKDGDGVDDPSEEDESVVSLQDDSGNDVKHDNIENVSNDLPQQLFLKSVTRKGNREPYRNEVDQVKHANPTRSNDDDSSDDYSVEVDGDTENSEDIGFAPRDGDDDDMDSGISGFSKEFEPSSKAKENRNALVNLVYFHHKSENKGRHGVKDCSRIGRMNRKRIASRLGRKEAALVLQPSLLMIMSMIQVATSPFGVTARDVVNWVESGSLPLFNAFDSMLDSKQRKTLQPIASFFRHHSLPTVAALKRVTICVHVACGYISPNVLPQKRKVEDKVKLNSKALTASSRTHRPINAALTLAKLVADLGLSQRVLNYSLAIMGYPVSAQSLQLGEMDQKIDPDSPAATDRPWLPPSLTKARPDRLNDVTSILAVIVIACKMIPDWDKNLNYAIKFDDCEHSGSISRSNASGRFVPWNNEYFRLLGNGKGEEKYLDFLEETILHSKKHILPKFVKSLNETAVPVIKSNLGEKSPVQANTSLLMIPLKLPGGKTKKQKVNKVEYIFSAFTKRTKEHTLSTPEGPLIEYFAYTTGSQADQIIDYMLTLEDELKKSAVYCEPRAKLIWLPTPEAFKTLLT